jgi:hypothetical protein
MRLFSAALAVSVIVCSAAVQAASILPLAHLDVPTLKIFQNYIADFEKTDLAPFNASGKLWIDGECCMKKATFDSGKNVVEPRENKDVGSGSIHHFTGTLHIRGGTIEAVRRVMQDYPDYPRYFGPDVTLGAGEIMPDSNPADEHYHSKLTLTESTLWINVEYHTVYDTHYLRLDPDRWVSRSASMSIKELIDPVNAARGYYPEGDDHGFLWRTNTYWFVRQSKGGIDLEANSITLSRQSPMGFVWWGTKRTREAVDKMLQDIKSAIEKK